MTESEPGRASRLSTATSRRFWAPVGAVLGGLAAAAAVLGFALDVFSGSDEAAGCEERSAAELVDPTVDTATLRFFLEHFSSSEGDDPLEGYTDEQLESEVHYVSVTVSVDGQKGRPVTLRWSMEDTSGSGGGGLPQNLSAVEITPPTCAHSHREHVLLDPPVPPGRTVVVELFLQDEAGNELAAPARTEPISSIA